VIASLVALFLVLRPPEKTSDNGVIRQVPTSTAAVNATATPTPPVTRTTTATTTAAASASPGTSPTPATTPTPGPKTYVVQPGDTLSAIAAANDTTIDEIVALNPGLDPNSLDVGAEIRLP